MTGQVISRPPDRHTCNPGWEWLPAQPCGALCELEVPGVRYGVPPRLNDYPKGTLWLCDCGHMWVSKGLDINAWALTPAFRRERWWERRRRLRR